MTPRAPASEREAALRSCSFHRGLDDWTNCVTHGWTGYREEVKRITVCPVVLAAHPTPPPPHPIDGKHSDHALPAATPSPDAGELERLQSALHSIVDHEPDYRDVVEPPSHEDCAECKRYEGHPVQRGMCDQLYRELERRDNATKTAVRAEQYDMRRIARAALEGAKPA
jgi:hypothetical protein